MKRDIEPKLRSIIQDPSVTETIIIEGARQVGKSYLVKSVLDNLNRHFKSFDLEKDTRLLGQINTTNGFTDFQQLMQDQYGVNPGSVLFIDEAQEAPVLARYIKSFKEDWHDVRVVLTGSSMKKMFDNKNRLPVGRTRSLCVYGFSFFEYVRFLHGDDLSDFLKSAPETIEQSRHTYLLDLFDSYCKAGGYPEAVKAQADNRSYREIIEEIYYTLTDDFRRKEAYEPSLFDNTLTAIANHIGSPSKLTSIDTTKYKAKQIIEALKAWHMVLEVKQAPLNPLHSTFLPKRYLHDIGLCNLKRSIAVPSISTLKTIDPALRTPLGGLFENALLINLLSGEHASKTIGTWKKDAQSGNEVDFIFEYPEAGVKIPVECKAACVIKKKHFGNISRYLELTGQPFGILVSAAPLEIAHASDSYRILNIPVYACSRKNFQEYYRRFQNR